VIKLCGILQLILLECVIELTFTRYHILASFCKEYLTIVDKNFRYLFSAVIPEHFSKNRMIISLVAAKIWYFKNVRFLLGHPVYQVFSLIYCHIISSKLITGIIILLLVSLCVCLPLLLFHWWIKIKYVLCLWQLQATAIYFHHKTAGALAVSCCQRISIGARPRGRCDMRSSRIITDYRLSQKRSISADEMFSTTCRMDRSWFDVIT